MSVSLQRKVSALLTSRPRFETPEALASCEALYQVSSSSPSFSLPPSSPSSLSLPLSLSPVPAQSTASPSSSSVQLSDSRRHLQLLMEQRMLDCHRQLYHAFAPLCSQAEHLSALLASLQRENRHVAQKVRQVKEVNEHLLSQTTALAREQSQVSHHKHLVQRLLQRIILTSKDQVQVEQGVVNSRRFFHALALVSALRKQASVLLSSSYQQAGLDVLEQLTRVSETGYERLYKYCMEAIQAGALNEAMSHDGEDDQEEDMAEEMNGETEEWKLTKGKSQPMDSSDEMFSLETEKQGMDCDSSTVQGLALLSAVPAYYDHCLTEWSQQCRLTMATSFISALTDGKSLDAEHESGNNSCVGIDVNAHDAVKYVTDMLAWVHAKSVYEADWIDRLMNRIQRALQHLQVRLYQPQVVGYVSEHNNDGISILPTPSFSPTDPLSAKENILDQKTILLSSIFENLARILKTRVEQSFINASTPAVAYKLWQVLSFYASLLVPMFSSHSTIASLLRALQEQSRQHFFALLAAQKVLIQSASRFHKPTPDLSPPSIVSELISQLHAIMHIRRTSPSEHSQDLTSILTALLDPIMCLLSEADLTIPVASHSGKSRFHTDLISLEDTNQLIYALNILHPVIEALSKYDSDAARVRCEILRLEMDNVRQQLIERLHNEVLSKCHLRDKVIALAEVTGSQLSNIPAFELSSLIRAMTSFEALLYSVGSFVVPQCDRILSAPLRRNCRQQVAEALARSYTNLYRAVHHNESGFDRPQAICKLTPHQIYTLLELKSSKLTLQTNLSPSNEGVTTADSTI